MFRFFVLAFALVAATNAINLDAIKPIAGGLMKGTVAQEKLQSVLAQANSDEKVKSIDNVKMQVVAGIRFIVDFTTQEDKQCTAIWVDAPWKNPKIQNVSVSCK
uniref:Cystatin domain-containing protein n=1 Tax=Lygus hesperus TaxID=30085 RepID=A0A146LP32_LYGHE